MCQASKPSSPSWVTQAERIVTAAGQAGGLDELRRLATYGWPHDRELEGDCFELRCAIQDEAKRVLASVE